MPFFLFISWDFCYTVGDASTSEEVYMRSSGITAILLCISLLLSALAVGFFACGEDISFMKPLPPSDAFYIEYGNMSIELL